MLYYNCMLKKIGIYEDTSLMKNFIRKLTNRLALGGKVHQTRDGSKGVGGNPPNVADRVGQILTELVKS